MHNGAQAVSNQNGDLITCAADVFNGIGNFFFGNRVEGRSGFIKNEQLWFAQQCTGYAKALFFATTYFN